MYTYMSAALFWSVASTDPGLLCPCQEERNEEGRYKAAWKREWKFPWRKYGLLKLSR